ncbi:hypothetical protein EV177_002310 [Coemansia sp. RSA 1804]|nr:hypothetical protein EV177_002310 [Coemansia sp. RSA 1804]
MKTARKRRPNKRKSNANQLERGVCSEYECMAPEQKRQRIDSGLQTPNSKANMYPLINDLIMLVAHHVRDKANGHNDAVAHRANSSALSSLVGTQLDPIGYTDLATILVCASVYLIQLAAVAYVVVNRKYAPIRALCPLSLAVMYAGSVVWFVGDVFTDDMAHPRGIATNCIVTTVWLRMVLGQNVVFGVLLVHAVLAMLRYTFHIDTTHSSRRRWIQFIATAGFAACDIALAIVATLLPKDRTVRFVDVLDVCEFKQAFKNMGVVQAWLLWGASFLISALVASKARCAHNEGRNLVAACVALSAALTFHTVVYYRKPMYPATLGWRIAAVCINQTSCLVAWWIIAGRTIYGCILYRDVYLAEWDERENDNDSAHSTDNKAY